MAARKAPLRTVKPGEKPPAKAAARSLTVSQAADVSERALLVALRSHLSSEMDKGAVPPHALSGVSAKIREYDREIRTLDARAEEEEASGDSEVGDGDFDASAV